MTDMYVAPAGTDQAAANALAAAQAVVGLLPSDEPLTLGEVGRLPQVIDGEGVSVRFSGSLSGELLIVVDRPVVDALAASPFGPLDVAQALKPAIEAAAATVGPIALGPAQALPAMPALDSLLTKPEALVVPLFAGSQVRAVVGLAVTGAVAAPAAPAPAAGLGIDFASSAGLDLLRGVEMEVTAELGRTKMTLNELLSLSDGAVIELDRAAGAPADLLVNGRLIARGEVVVIDENFGLRITEIVADSGMR